MVPCSTAHLDKFVVELSKMRFLMSFKAREWDFVLRAAL